MVLCNFFYWIYLVLLDTFLWKLEKYILSLWPWETGFLACALPFEGMILLNFLFLSGEKLGDSYSLYLKPCKVWCVGGKKLKIMYALPTTVDMYKKEGGLPRPAALCSAILCLVKLGWGAPFTAPRGRLNSSLVKGSSVIVACSSGCVFYSGYALPILSLGMFLEREGA